MPQLVKGGKWVFGWTVVSPDKEILIPAEAFQEYMFHQEDPVVFILGSRRSGGFGLGHRGKVTSSIIRPRIFAEGHIGKEMHVPLPSVIEITPGTQLLVVRGSDMALSFLLKGPIVDEACLHPDLEVYRT